MSGNLGYIRLRLSYGHHISSKTYIISLRTATVSNLSCSAWPSLNNKQLCARMHSRAHIRIYWTQRFCFSSLFRQKVKFVKWRLPCISHFVCCSLQLLQSLKPADEVARKNSPWKCNIHWQIMTLFSRFVFSDEASFHLSGKVNRHNDWEEFYFRLDVCRVTNGAHIEHW